MKKLLSILLALAMLAGLSAVGADAFTPPKFVLPRSPALQALDPGDTDMIDQLLNFAVLSAIFVTPGAFMAMNFTNPGGDVYAAALTDPSLLADLVGELETALDNINGAFASVWSGIVGGQDLEALYRGGQLLATAQAQFTAAIDPTEVDGILAAYLTADALAFFYGPYNALIVDALPILLSEFFYDLTGDGAFLDITDRFPDAIDLVELMTYISAGQWADAETLINGALPAVRELAAEAESLIAAFLTPETYDVTYDANAGGDTVTGMPAAQVKTEDVTLVLSTAIPARAGYSFKGWATSPTGAVAYAAGADYTDNADLPLYAVWGVIPTYPVTYDANAGDDTVTGMPAAQTKVEDVTLVLSTLIPMRAGYTFRGWATSADGAVAYARGAGYTDNAPLALYAVWKLNEVPPTPTPTPKYFWSSWSKLMQWILKYPLWGWVWMRWVKPL